MVQVKEFISDLSQIGPLINAWIKEHTDIEIVDIKYSVSAFPLDEIGVDSGVYSGALIIYKTK